MTAPGTSSPVAARGRVDVFARARAEGQLRADLADLEIADWFRFVNFTLLLREDLDREGQKRVLRTFVLLALLPGAAAGQSASG